MEDSYTKKLSEYIDNSSLNHAEKEEVGQLVNKIDKQLTLLEFKYRRTLKEKNAINNLLSQISKDLTLKMEESEEKSKILELNNQELESARAFADQANQTKSRFLANMSHEIRTPINGVLGMVQLLELTNISQEQQDYISSLKVGGESLLYIVNEILDFSKIEAGKIELEKQTYAIKTDIASTLDLLSPLAAAKGIELNYKIGDDVPDLLIGDNIRIRQVLTNLVGNGIKFTDQGFVSLSVSKAPHSLGENMFHFSIQDSGIGIQEAQLSKLFQPFTQVDASTTRKYGGTGLGLAITARLIKMMGGKIWVESELGKGSVFHFLLPLESYVPPETEQKQNHPLKKTCSYLDHEMAQKFPLKILLAEDDEISQILAETCFQKMGYDIKIASDGELALQMATKEAFDIIFMDLHMPKMEGIEASKHIRSFYGDSSSPIIIAMTANVFQEVGDTCIRGGMNDFINKPYKLTDLQAMIEKWGVKLQLSKI